MEAEPEFSILTCPTDVIYLIVNYLAVRSIIKLTATCKHMSSINCPALMKSIMLRKNDQRIRPAMQKLALFTRLQNLVLGLQSEDEENIYEGLKNLTTLTQLRHLTLRVKLDWLDRLGEFFNSLISLQSLNLHMVPQSDYASVSLNGLQHLGTKLESLTLTVSAYKNMDFLPHLKNLKYLLLVAPDLKQPVMEHILKLTTLTNFAMSTSEYEHDNFYRNISKLKSLQMFIGNYTGRWGWGVQLTNPLSHISTSLPNLHTLIWNTHNNTPEIPEEITRLEHLRIFRTRSNITPSEVVKLLRLPYLEIQTDGNETYETISKTRQKMIEEMKLNRPNVSDEEISNSIAQVRMVDRGLFLY